MARIDDGHPTTIDFSLNPVVHFYEKSVTPPGIAAGGANDTTTMRNIKLRTKAPKKLVSMKDMVATVSYDPAFFNDVQDMVGINQLITVTFADGSTLQFWGWLDDFSPGPSVEGAQPTADVTIIASNQDDSGVETDYVCSVAA